ncbi:sulfite exporter TauE/SafE family protein [Calditerricola satsumensis]|uniref:Probable membrane transporter protein n=1 Tax=Calditerricola satsumensis TaxID=373054 RepID=A0A8J3B8T5_9BACI|nr:sulfite exporter TauE/SafE family protein [Calditerricola satsumensis]GGJ93731.1 UPF0721 transmembrane protein YrkJ [Calditerricola satsumensis]
MSWAEALTLFAIGFVGSFISGMVGIGGSIIKYPMLLYIPPLLGVASYSAQEVAAVSAVQVFFATLAGVWAYRKDRYIHPKLVAYMGTAIIFGSFLGGFGSKFLDNATINFVYAVLAAIAAVMMFIPRPEREARYEEVTFSKPIATLSAFVVGLLSGIVGAAGAFILIPIMLVVLNIPTRVAIASSMAITFISSIGATVGKVLTGHLLFWPAVIMVIASTLASPLGVRVAKRVKAKILKGILAALILATALKIWVDILF